MRSGERLHLDRFIQGKYYFLDWVGGVSTPVGEPQRLLQGLLVRRKRRASYG